MTCLTPQPVAPPPDPTGALLPGPRPGPAPMTLPATTGREPSLPARHKAPRASAPRTRPDEARPRPRHRTGQQKLPHQPAKPPGTRPRPTTSPSIAPRRDPPTTRYPAGYRHRITYRTLPRRSCTNREPLDTNAHAKGHPLLPTAPNPCPHWSNPPNPPKPPHLHITRTGATRRLTTSTQTRTTPHNPLHSDADPAHLGRR